MKFNIKKINDKTLECWHSDDVLNIDVIGKITQIQIQAANALIQQEALKCYTDDEILNLYNEFKNEASKRRLL